MADVNVLGGRLQERLGGWGKGGGNVSTTSPENRLTVFSLFHVAMFQQAWQTIAW